MQQLRRAGEVLGQAPGVQGSGEGVGQQPVAAAGEDPDSVQRVPVEGLGNGEKTPGQEPRTRL
ncbi:hypothetical protein [Kitasatospora sp. NPDC001225]